MALTILLAYYHETKLSIPAAIDYVIALRPVCDFSTSEIYGSSTATMGGWGTTSISGGVGRTQCYVCDADRTHTGRVIFVSMLRQRTAEPAERAPRFRPGGHGGRRVCK